MDPKELAVFPRLGWIDDTSPVTPLPDVATTLGLDYLGVKRDDLCQALYGGTKIRKLDYLLALPRFRDRRRWIACGAIGSGQLVAVAAAAAELGHELSAYVFWEPISEGVLDNLAFIADGATEIHFVHSRLALATRHPKVMLSELLGRDAVGADDALIPLGATSPHGMLGMVRAALELRDQIQNGELPTPDEIVIAYGTGGAAAGLSVGLALAGLPTKVRAVAAVERALSPASHLRQLQRDLLALLRDSDVPGSSDASPMRIAVERGAVGPGYGHVTDAALDACERAAEHGVPLEPVYTGKAFGALLARDWPEGQRVLFWNTRHRGSLPKSENWKQKLPHALAERLAHPEARRVGRRRMLALSAAGLGGAALIRTSGYPAVAWRRRALFEWEAQVLRSAAEVLLRPFATLDELERLPRLVDRYVASLPSWTRRELHGAFVVLEHGTTPLGIGLSRFSDSSLQARERHFARLVAVGGLMPQVVRAMRELCMLGYYQQEGTWVGIGYTGPLVPASVADRPDWPTYEGLRAPAGAMPKSAVA